MSKNIYNGKVVTVPFNIVQHTENHWYPSDEVKDATTMRGLLIVTKHTTWSTEIDYWENNIYLDKSEASKFLDQWTAWLNENQ